MISNSSSINDNWNIAAFEFKNINIKTCGLFYHIIAINIHVLALFIVWILGYTGKVGLFLICCFNTNTDLFI